MRLDLAAFQVDRMTLGSSTMLSGRELQVDVGEVKRLVLADDHFTDVKVYVAHPGESVRIIHALDVVEPRYKVSGPGGVFPGVLGPPVSVGEGVTNRLGGMAIVTVGEPLAGEPTYWRESIIDMSGPGAPYSPFSETANLVLELKSSVTPPSDSGSTIHSDDTIRGSKYSQEYNRAVRVAGFKVASHLAQVTADLTPDRVDVYELKPVNESLPKVVYASEEAGDFLYGSSMGWQPTLLHPNELFDGVIFRAFNGPASIREATYFYQSHPVVEAMYRRHGVDLNFLGVLLYPFGGERLDEKERGTSFASNLLHLIGANGVVLSWIGGGHPGIDVMLLCRKCEQLGIQTTILNPEMARHPGDSGFVHYVSEADAIVSTGNYERMLTLPPANRVIGGKTILGSDADASATLSVTIGLLYGSTSPLGNSKLMGVQY